MTDRLVLVGCVKGKKTGRWPAKDLYSSTLFAGRRKYAERTGQPRYILGAKYGLVHPDEPIECYEASLKDMNALSRRQWSQQVLCQLDRVVPQLKGCLVELHAGKEYRQFGLHEGLARRGADVETPTEHLGLGQQLAWYQRENKP